AWRHDTDAAQATGASGTVPVDGVVINLKQAIGAAIFEDLPILHVRLALKILRMPDGRIGHTVLGMAAQVDVVLAALGLAADAEVLNGATDDAHRMALEVRQTDEHIRRRNGLGNVRLFQKISGGNVDTVIARANKTIGTNKGATQNRGA